MESIKGAYQKVRPSSVGFLSVFQTAEPLSETAQKIGLNHHVDQWRSLTNATEFRVLWFVSKYAVKYPGTAHLKAATIAEGLEVSTKPFIVH